ncbi:hypothetical protein P692DRAFT_2029402 [Suillus brevipes Sb2]|nr:hypothetical protein P692DRAFT_2029402 [Suillus brevipes Sb2]
MLREKLTDTASQPFRGQHKSLHLVKTLRRFDFLLPGLSSTTCCPNPTHRDHVRERESADKHWQLMSSYHFCNVSLD